MATPPDPLVHDFVAALDQYRKAREEQHMNLATRPPDDLGDAAAGVRTALKALVSDLA